MKEITKTIQMAMEQAAVLGLCHEGQLEIAVQTVHQAFPQFSVEAVAALVEAESGI